MGKRPIADRQAKAAGERTAKAILPPAACLILLSNRNKTIFAAGFAPCFVIVLGNTRSIPCGRCLA